MGFVISLLNGIAVSLFGSILSACFCDALTTRRQRRIFWLGMVLILLLQGLVCLFLGAGFVKVIYPLIVHFPLILLLYVLTGKWLWTIITVLFAYSCCQLRRWIALLIVGMLFGSTMMQDVTELVITIPILLLLLRIAVPAVRQLADNPVGIQIQFGIIPAVYYIFDYLTSVYTDLLKSGDPVIVEFMPFVCCAAYLVFLLYHSAKVRSQNELLQLQNSIDLQLAQALREIDELRKSQELARQYRHDLRHHLQYLSACMENGKEEQAQTYISHICREMESQKIKQYCENETANLILSAFVDRAEKAGIKMTVQSALPAAVKIADNDLCVLLSNALENALHACQKLTDRGEHCTIAVQVFQKKDNVFLQVTNPCGEAVRFEKGIPVSDRPGHGIGVQSICAIVEKYHGLYTFLKQEDQFILRISFNL